MLGSPISGNSHVVRRAFWALGCRIPGSSFEDLRFCGKRFRALGFRGLGFRVEALEIITRSPLLYIA